MAVILYVGCGDLATGSAKHLAEEGHQCLGLRRNPQQLPEYIQGIQADLLKPDSLSVLPTKIDYVVITLTPAEFSESAYQQIYIAGLSNLLQALAAKSSQPKRLFFASSTSVYHQNQGDWVDEDSETKPSSFSGNTMLAAEALLADLGYPATSIRYSGIYGPGRERMLKWADAGADAPSTPVHFSNRIHQEDCSAIINHLIRLDLSGSKLASCYLASDDKPSTFNEVLSWLREQLGVAINPDAQETKRIRTGSKRCRNERLKASGYVFIHPDFRSGYQPMVTSFKQRKIDN